MNSCFAFKTFKRNERIAYYIRLYFSLINEHDTDETNMILLSWECSSAIDSCVRRVRSLYVILLLLNVTSNREVYFRLPLLEG